MTTDHDTDNDAHDAILHRVSMLIRDAERTPAGMEILEVALDDVAMLVGKQCAYGDSALSPVRVFSKATPREGLLVRADDKLSRIMHGENVGEDPYRDLRGYLNLIEVGRRRDEEAGSSDLV